MSLSYEKIKYTPTPDFRWKIPSKIISGLSSDDICEACDSLLKEENKKLKAENNSLKKLVEFWKNEAQSLLLKTALEVKAAPLDKMVAEVASTPEGKAAWEEAWKEQFSEWQELVKQGKMSRIKYYRLINGIDQRTLAEKLGTAQPNISRIEKVGYNVPIKTLKKLAEIFNAKMEDLVGE
ncbi:MAG: helix-turn-helix transcriptional regulator [Nitrospiraceae bacterium]|nr:helix-turn-helix transcriptional regulator [Nitrospiraceae bacterium]